MTKKLFVGIDVGTTVLKAAVFDAQTGRETAFVESRLTVNTAGDGTREIAAAELDRSFDTAFRRLQLTTRSEWKKIRGIGLASQGGSTAIADRGTGRALTPMVLWNDQRAHRFLAEIAQSKPLSFWRRVTARDEPGMGLARIRWFRESHPKLVRDENILTGVGEYLFFRLTGHWRQDAGNALQLGCYNVQTRDLDQRLVDLADVALSFFSPIRKGHTTCPLSESSAERYGLPGSIPVAGPYFDHEAGLLSATGVSKLPLQCSLGTAWAGNFFLSGKATGFSPLQFELPSPLEGDATNRMICQVIVAGNVTLDWGLKMLIDPNHKKALRKLPEIFDRALLPPPGLVAFPWFTQSNPFAEGLIGGGSFFGLNERTEREDLLRALASGLVFEFMRILENVKSDGVADSVVLSGGSGKGIFFQELLAALFAPLPLFTSEYGDQSGVRGALYPFSKRIAQPKTRCIKPPHRKIREEIEQGFQQYKELHGRFFLKCFGEPFTSGIR